MRIISGKYKGRIINAPLNLPVRPTTDFAKTGLFNILRSRFRIENASVLDLFSGTGNVSYEFISRNCKELTAVDNNATCITFIKSIFNTLKINNALAIKENAFDFIKSSQEKYNFIFADPPFEFLNYEELISGIFTNNLLSENGIFILEHNSKKHFNENKFFIEERKYGNISFSFFKPENIL